MFVFALLLGLYAIILFFLGIAGLFYKNVLIVFTVVFFSAFLLWQRQNIVSGIKRFTFSRQKFFLFLLFVLLLQGMVNLIGVFGPELSFDALWYHLTLPKLYLLNHSVYHISGGLLYYSDMPKLGEMFYAVALLFGNEILAKLIHFSFGILTAVALYLFARKFFTPILSIIAVVIFYANLVVAWESTTAYVDLIRTFFEIMALWSFINWRETLSKKWLYVSAIMLGLAITTKLLAIGSLIIFTVLLLSSRAKETIIYLLVALLIPLPWLLFAYLHTGNPVYPFFSNIYQISPEPLSIFSAARDIWGVLTQASDPISPVYLIFLPLVFITYKKLPKFVKPIVWYSLLAIVIWYFTPRTGGGRFLMPYLPAMSIVCAGVLSVILKGRKITKSYLGMFLVGIILFVSFISIGYRFIANSKFLPVIIGQQTKQDFLSNNLNFAFGDFYDTDDYFKENIQTTDTVLLYGFHNLYYAEFPYIDSSWVKKGDRYNYIALQKTELPKQFKDWQLIYSNAKTMVKLYKPPKNICKEKCIY